MNLFHQKLIKRIAVGRDKVTASYRNKGNEAKRPRYTIRLYNQYGFLLGEDTIGKIPVFGGTGAIKPDDVATERLRIEWLPLDRVKLASTRRAARKLELTARDASAARHKLANMPRSTRTQRDQTFV